MFNNNNDLFSRIFLYQYNEQHYIRNLNREINDSLGSEALLIKIFGSNDLLRFTKLFGSN